MEENKTEERWEIRLGNIRVGACGCKNCVASQELLQFIKSEIKKAFERGVNKA